MAGTRVDNAALFAVLSSLADNKQAIGRRYAYWSNGAPALEAAVAAAAMTQDELGHARTLYPLLGDFTQAEQEPQQIEPMTRTLHYHLTFLDHDFQGWSDFVATNFLVDNALTTFFEAAQDSSYEPLRLRSRKIVQRWSGMWACSRSASMPSTARAGSVAWRKRAVLSAPSWSRPSIACGMRRSAGLVRTTIPLCSSCTRMASLMLPPLNCAVVTWTR